METRFKERGRSDGHGRGKAAERCKVQRWFEGRWMGGSVEGDGEGNIEKRKKNTVAVKTWVLSSVEGNGKGWSLSNADVEVV